MKHLSILLLSTLLVLSGTAKDVYIQESELPAKVTQFVSKHFPKQKIVQSKKDFDKRSFTYKLVLNNGAKLEFLDNGEVIKIKSKTKLPDALIHPKILRYVSDTFPGYHITEWKRKSMKQEVELDNGIEIEFDLNGNFLKID